MKVRYSHDRQRSRGNLPGIWNSVFLWWFAPGTNHASRIRVQRLGYLLGMVGGGARAGEVALCPGLGRYLLDGLKTTKPSSGVALHHTRKP